MLEKIKSVIANSGRNSEKESQSEREKLEKEVQKLEEKDRLRELKLKRKELKQKYGEKSIFGQFLDTIAPKKEVSEDVDIIELWTGISKEPKRDWEREPSDKYDIFEPPFVTPEGAEPSESLDLADKDLDHGNNGIDLGQLDLDLSNRDLDHGNNDLEFPMEI